MFMVFVIEGCSIRRYLETGYWGVQCVHLCVHLIIIEGYILFWIMVKEMCIDHKY